MLDVMYGIKPEPFNSKSNLLCLEERRSENFELSSLRVNIHGHKRRFELQTRFLKNGYFFEFGYVLHLKIFIFLNRLCFTHKNRLCFTPKNQR